MRESEEAMLARYYAQVESLSAAAFEAGCRLAVTQPIKVMNAKSGNFEWLWMHVILSAGENPPPGINRRWTIYEQRNGMAVGRSM